jgi:hypothetical protein
MKMLDRPRVRSVIGLEAVLNPDRVMDQHVPTRAVETWINRVPVRHQVRPSQGNSLETLLMGGPNEFR